MLFVNFSARRWHKMTTGRIRSIIIYSLFGKKQSSFERILAKFQSISPTAAVILKEVLPMLHGVKIVMKAEIFQKKDNISNHKSLLKVHTNVWNASCGPTFFNPCFIKEFVWTDVRNLYTFLRCLFHFAYSSFSK